MVLPYGLDIILSAVLLCFSAMFSGLNLGVLSLDLNDLEIIKEAGSPEEREYAKRLLPVRSRGNWLLCTLLLGNVAVNSALSILLADLTSGAVGFAISTVLIVLLGEVVPQAVCARHPLSIGARLSGAIYVVRAALSPVAYPLSLVLDAVLGKEMPSVYNRAHFQKLVELQVQRSQQFGKSEGQILRGALEYGSRKVAEVLTPIDQVFMVDVNRRLDVDLLTAIFRSGYSRIPCYDGEDPRRPIVGLLITKDLILIDPNEGIPLRAVLEIYGRQVLQVAPDTTLSHLLELFKSGKGHMAVVVGDERRAAAAAAATAAAAAAAATAAEAPAAAGAASGGEGDGEGGDEEGTHRALGIITLEDVIEAIIQDEIIDEIDAQLHPQADRNQLPANQKALEELRRLRMNFGAARRQLPSLVTPQECASIVHQLVHEVAIFGPEQHVLQERFLRNLVMRSALVEVREPYGKKGGDSSESDSDADEATGVDVSAGGEWLYKRGQPSDYCTLVLDGRVTVYASKQRFKSTVGRGALLCADALEEITPAVVRQLLQLQGRELSWAPAPAPAPAAKSPQPDADNAPTPEISPRGPDKSPQEQQGAQQRGSSRALQQALLRDASPVPPGAPAVGRMLPPYVPDFSARAVFPCRVLRISRVAYAETLLAQERGAAPEQPPLAEPERKGSALSAAARKAPVVPEAVAKKLVAMEKAGSEGGLVAPLSQRRRAHSHTAAQPPAGLAPPQPQPQPQADAAKARSPSAAQATAVAAASASAAAAAAPSDKDQVVKQSASSDSGQPLMAGPSIEEP